MADEERKEGEPFAETKRATYSELRKSFEERVREALADPYNLATYLYRVYATLFILDAIEKGAVSPEKVSLDGFSYRAVNPASTESTEE